jgi:hypothetical protein
MNHESCIFRWAPYQLRGFDSGVADLDEVGIVRMVLRRVGENELDEPEDDSQIVAHLVPHRAIEPRSFSQRISPSFVIHDS